MTARTETPTADTRRSGSRFSSDVRTLHGPVSPFDRPAVSLLLVSASLLFAELLLIRWIPAEIIYVGYFRNLILLGSFLGIGVGIILGRGGAYPSIPVLSFVLFALVAVVSVMQLNVYVASSDEIFFGLTESSSRADTNFLVLPAIFLMATVIMALLALPLGPLLRSMPPLRAYTLDILGSLTGIALFTFLSWFQTPPLIWFIVLAGMIGSRALARPITGWSVIGGCALAAMLVIVVGATINAARLNEVWSPYQRIDIQRGVDGSVGITVNGIPHQALKGTGIASEDVDSDLFYSSFYYQVDKWFPDRVFKRVLVIGAGTGNDVAARLARGATTVDAVEIDPVLASIGQAEHPDRPYQDPGVNLKIDDGRSFLRDAKGPYDLVVFALPDSLTLVGSTANIRLESFLFTQEAFSAVRDELGPNGVFALYNYYRQPWLIDKIGGMLRTAFGSPPIIRTFGAEPASAAVIAAGPGIAGATAAMVLDPASPPVPATDDWPFLYLHAPEIADYYLIVFGLIALFALLGVFGALRVSHTPIRRFSPHFFMLGVAFMLLETRSLTTFALLFGNTWLINSLVFFAILVSVLLAILVNARFQLRDQRPIYLALGICLALNLFLDPAALLVDPPAVRYGLAAALAFAPVFFANLVFTRSFRDTATADMSFASNLLGATFGGILEYVALISGYRMLVVVVAVCYLLAYLFATRIRLLADRDLVVDDDVGIDPSPVGVPDPAS